MLKTTRTAARRLVAGFAILAGLAWSSGPGFAVEPIFQVPPEFDSLWFGICDPATAGAGPKGTAGCKDHQFVATSVSAGGLVVGYDIFDPSSSVASGTPSTSFYKHAAIFLPNFDGTSPSTGPHDFYLLDDAPGNYIDGADVYGFSLSSFSSLSSWAKDVNDAGTAIVGSALIRGSTSCLDELCAGSEDDDMTFYAPLLWTGSFPTGPTVDYVPTALPVLVGLSSSYAYQGGARGITPGANVLESTIVGWSGYIDCEYWCNGSLARDLEAVRWRYGELPEAVIATGWVIEQLNPDEEKLTGYWGNDSVANRSSDDGDVIGGWIGSDKTFRKAWEVAGDFWFRAEPFIWTPADGMRILPLLTVAATADVGTEEPSVITHNIGNVHDVSGDGTMAVGWSGFYLEECGKSSDCGVSGIVPYQAVYWEGGDWSSLPVATALGAIDFSEGIPGPSQVVEPVEVKGTVANAVDQHGNVIVGQVDVVGCNELVACEVANGAIDIPTSRAVIWERANGFEGFLIQVLLAHEGIDLGNYVMTAATGVRTIYDEETGIPTDTIITGNGVAIEDAVPTSPGGESLDTGDFTDPAWLVRFGKIPGVTSLPDQAKTFTSISSLLDGVNGGATLSGLGDVAHHNLCMPLNGEGPVGEGAVNPWCFFAFGTGTWLTDTPEGTQFVGDVGIARYLTMADSVALSVGASQTSVDVAGASYDGNGVHVGAYAAHMPESGLQAYVAGTYAWFTDIDITRTYANGTGTASSLGSTDGWGWGLSGWAGYAIPLNARNTLTPFVEITHVASHFNGWTETGGPFPASFASTEGSATDLRLGVEDQWKLTAMTTLFGSVAWVHRLSGGAPTINGSLLVAGCNTSTPLTPFCNIAATAGSNSDWFEGTVGSRFQLTADSVASLSLTVDAGGGFTAFTGRVGYSKSF